MYICTYLCIYEYINYMHAYMCAYMYNKHTNACVHFVYIYTFVCACISKDSKMVYVGES